MVTPWRAPDNGQAIGGVKRQPARTAPATADNRHSLWPASGSRWCRDLAWSKDPSHNKLQALLRRCLVRGAQCTKNGQKPVSEESYAYWRSGFKSDGLCGQGYLFEKIQLEKSKPLKCLKRQQHQAISTSDPCQYRPH